jgi:hypothetical protein
MVHALTVRRRVRQAAPHRPSASTRAKGGVGGAAGRDLRVVQLPQAFAVEFAESAGRRGRRISAPGHERAASRRNLHHAAVASDPARGRHAGLLLRAAQSARQHPSLTPLLPQKMLRCPQEVPSRFQQGSLAQEVHFQPELDFWFLLTEFSQPAGWQEWGSCLRPGEELGRHRLGFERPRNSARDGLLVAASNLRGFRCERLTAFGPGAPQSGTGVAAARGFSIGRESCSRDGALEE